MNCYKISRILNNYKAIYIIASQKNKYHIILSGITTNCFCIVLQDGSSVPVSLFLLFTIRQRVR